MSLLLVSGAAHMRIAKCPQHRVRPGLVPGALGLEPRQNVGLDQDSIRT